MLADVDVNAFTKKQFFKKKNFSLNDAIDFLMNTDDNSDIDSSSDEDDMDSDASDDMNDGPVHHLPRRLLNSTCDSSLLDKGNKQKSVQRTQPPNKKSRKLATKN